MGWFLLIAAALGIIIYAINKDYKADLNTNVINRGGMQEKYNILVLYFTSLPSARITKLTNSNITISSPSSTVFIEYGAGSTEVSVNMMLPTGKISKSFKFPNGYPQEKMIQDIENYLDWEADKFKAAVNQNIYQYIK